MKIAVTSTGPTLEDAVADRIDLAACWLIVKSPSMRYTKVGNPFAIVKGPTGVELVARLLASDDVGTVVTGACPRKFTTLFSANGINVVTQKAESACEAVMSLTKSRVPQFAVGGV